MSPPKEPSPLDEPLAESPNLDRFYAAEPEALTDAELTALVEAQRAERLRRAERKRPKKL